MTRVVSGMRPTGPLHIGHYQGVLKNWLALQKQHECFFFVADWHALTTDYEDTRFLPSYIREILIDWLAVGIDPELCNIFIQSHVPAHAELHLLLSMITPLGWLERIPSYKDTQAKLTSKDLATYGFLGYPLLQSADILIYRANWVPVGEDQVSHVEIAREIARRFNFLFGRGETYKSGTEILLEPQSLLTKISKLPGLDGQKMSKSYGNTIGLREEPRRIEQKIRTMPTDPARMRRNDPGTPEKCPVWPLHQVYSEAETQAWVKQGCTTAGIGCLDCKKKLTDAILEVQRPILERARQYSENPTLLDKIIEKGCAYAEIEANKTLRMVKQAMGLN